MTSTNRQAERSQIARDNIVQAALAVFALKGYAAASMDDVCLAAGCSKGGLYHHFRTKRSVLFGVVNRLGRDGALLPPFGAHDAAARPAASWGRVLIDVWTEASRDAELQLALAAGCQERDAAAEPDDTGGLADIVRIGALVQLLTQAPEINADEAARRLGIERAA